MALDTFVAGPYVGTYNAVGIGLTEDGYDLDAGLKQEVIDESDGYGNSLLDYIYRGGDAFMNWSAKAFKPGSISPLWPWGGSLGEISSTTGPVGRLASDMALPLILTAVANTPAAVVGNACVTFTASKSILAPGFGIKLNFNSKLRKVPTRLALLPYVSTTKIINFTLA